MNMKKISYLLLITLLTSLLSVNSSFGQSTLTSDINDSDVKVAVEMLSSLGIINGMEDGKYHSEELVTREQFAKIMVVTLGLEDLVAENQNETKFSDVSYDRWSSGYINVAVEEEIINGYPDGTFKPSETVSYAELLTMIIRSLGYTEDYLTGPWPENYIQKASNLQVIENIEYESTMYVDRGLATVLVDNSLEVPMFEENSSGEYETLLSKKQKDIEEDSNEPSVELTLEDAINIALENNPNIEDAKLNLEQSKINYDKENYSISKNKSKLEDNSIEYLEQVTKKEVSNDLSWEIAQREYQDIIDEQIKKVEELYFDVLHAQNNVNIKEENLELVESLYEKVKKEFSVGIVSQTEVTSSELNYEKAQKDLNTAKNMLEIAEMNLNNMLGNNIMDDIIVTDELQYKEFEEINITEVVNESLENRVDVLNAKLSYEVAKVEMEIVASKYPDIVFEYKEKEVTLKETEQNLENIRNIARLDINNKYLDVIGKEDSITSIEKSIEILQKELESITLKYDLGMAVLTDVQQAQIKLESEKLLLTKTTLDYNIAVIEFEKSLGNELE